MLHLQKNIEKSSSQKPQGGCSWKFTEMFITFASTKIMFFIAIARVFCGYGNLKFP